MPRCMCHLQRFSARDSACVAASVSEWLPACPNPMGKGGRVSSLGWSAEGTIQPAKWRTGMSALPCSAPHISLIESKHVLFAQSGEEWKVIAPQAFRAPTFNDERLILPTRL